MERRGISHIEVILSFILFISAIGIALYFFSPFDSTRLVKSSQEYAYREIVKNSSVKVELYSVEINNTNGQINEDGSLVLPIFIDGICGAANGAAARNTVGDEMQARVNCESENGENNTVYVKNPAPAGWAENDFIFLILSEDVDSSTENLGMPALNESWYVIASSEVKKMMSEKRVWDLRENYQNDYFEVKREFNLPNRVQFGFILNFNDGTNISATQQIPEGFEVYSDSRSVEVLRDDGKIEFAELNIVLW